MKNKMNSLSLFTVLSLASFGVSNSTYANQSDSATEIVTSAQTDSTQPSQTKTAKKASKKIFFLGICAGQTLFKQGIDFSNLSSSATKEDLKLAMKAAIKTCREQMTPPPAAPTTPQTSTGISTSTSTDTSTSASVNAEVSQP